MRHALLSLLVVACRSPAAPPRQPDPTRIELAAGDLTFTGMCDASGAVLLGPKAFAVADDEDGILRIYDLERGGPPTATFDISAAVIPEALRDQIAASDEIDTEGAARIGNVAFWISSHSRRKNGDAAPARFRLFSTTTPAHDEPIRVLGTTTLLLAAISAEPTLARIAAAAALSPVAGGINIEGLSQRAEGGLWIGFRSPVIHGKAVLLGLVNPNEMIAGAPAKLVGPVLLPLGGRGIRAMTRHRGRYLLVAGDPSHARRSVVYVWDGTTAREIAGLDLTQFNAEAFVADEARARVMVLSDDGSVVIDGIECKSSAPAKKRFHGRWISIPGR